LGELGVDADLRRHHPGEPGDLLRVLEAVLAVGGPELEPADELDQLGMEAVDAHLEAGLLALVLQVLLHVLLDLLDDLLDGRRMVVARTSLALTSAVSRASSSRRMARSCASRRASPSIAARSWRFASSAVSPAIVSSLRFCSSSAEARRPSFSPSTFSRVMRSRSLVADSVSRRSSWSSFRARSSSLERTRCSICWISRSRRRVSSSKIIRALRAVSLAS